MPAIRNIIHKKPICLVNGGKQRRSFTYVDDGINALMKIIENKDNCAEGRIFNIGNPNNDSSIEGLALLIKKIVSQKYPKYSDSISLTSVDENDYYGDNYEDISARVPSIYNSKKYLDWEPKISLEIALEKPLDFYLAS